MHLEKIYKMKIVAIIKDNEIISATEYTGDAEIKVQQSSVYIDTPENLLLIMSAIGVEDTSKLEIFMT